MNATDIRKAAEERLAELEREVAELRRMLGKDTPAPAVNPAQWIPMPYPVPAVVPYIEPWRPLDPFGPIYRGMVTSDRIEIHNGHPKDLAQLSTGVTLTIQSGNGLPNTETIYYTSSSVQ